MDLHGLHMPRVIANVRLPGVILHKANLQGARLLNPNLQEAYLEQANLQGTTFVEANLRKAYLKRANLQEAELRDANLQQARLESANLQGADLSRANLQGADLHDANLQQAKLGGINLQGVDLQDAQLQGAGFWDAKRLNFPPARVSKAQLLVARFDKTTTLPDGRKLTHAALQKELDASDRQWHWPEEIQKEHRYQVSGNNTFAPWED